MIGAAAGTAKANVECGSKLAASNRRVATAIGHSGANAGWSTEAFSRQSRFGKEITALGSAWST
jgi:hypothetical protein